MPYMVPDKHFQEIELVPDSETSLDQTLINLGPPANFNLSV
jgi:hypothetical protein